MPEPSLRSVEIMQIVAQTAHVGGDPFGGMTMINILANERNATMFITSPSVQGAGWDTEAYPVDLAQIRQFVDALGSEGQRVVSTARDTDDPLDYMMFYYVSGHVFGQSIDLRIEQVITSRHPMETSRAYDAITSLLQIPATSA